MELDNVVGGEDTNRVWKKFSEISMELRMDCTS